MIPCGLDFADLQLEITEEGGLLYLLTPLQQFADRNQIEPELMRDEHWAAATIAGWYVIHRQVGGAIDSAAEGALRNLSVLTD